MALSRKQKRQRRERILQTACIGLSLVSLTLLVWLAQIVDEFYADGIF